MTEPSGWEAGTIRALDAAQSGLLLPLVEGPGAAWAVVWPGMGAHFRSLHRLSLGRGAQTVELRHPMEAVYYVLEGSGVVLDPGDGSRQEVTAGSMIHTDPGTRYRFIAGDRGLELAGGPCPPDLALYAHLKSP